MTSGPISRFEQLGVNIFQNKEFCYKQVTDGLKRIAWGLIKKRGLADSYFLLWNTVIYGFFRMHGYCNRNSTMLWNSGTGKFQSTIFSKKHKRFLAQMAHIIELMVKRLYIYSAGRK